MGRAVNPDTRTLHAIMPKDLTAESAAAEPECDDSDDIEPDWSSINVMNNPDHEEPYGRSGFGKYGYAKQPNNPIQIDGQWVHLRYRYRHPRCTGEIGGRLRWVDSEDEWLCYEEEDRGSITGGGGDQATVSDLESGPIGETLRDTTRSGALGGSHGIGQGARWYARGPATDIPDPNSLTFDPVIGTSPSRGYLWLAPNYVWLENVRKSCLPRESPFPAANPGPRAWTGCEAGVVEGAEPVGNPITYPIIWPTVDAPLEDKVVRQAGTRHRAVAAHKMEIDLESDGIVDHTCWTEDADVAAAEATLDRSWVWSKGAAAPGLRFVHSRPDNRRDSGVHPQDNDCAVLYREPGTYTMRVTIHWRAWEWETGPSGTTLPREVTRDLPDQHATTSASIEVGVCELHTIPTDRFPDPGPPPPGYARSCIAGDDW